MEDIKTYNEFLYEKIGINDDIEKLSDIIIEKMKNKNYFSYETNYLGKDITIEFFLKRIDKTRNAYISVTDKENYVFKIVLKSLDKILIVHELKHLDRMIRTKFKRDDFFYTNRASQFLSKHYWFLFKDKLSSLIFSTIFYYSDQDEFESQFHDIYMTIKENLHVNMDKEEKFLLVKNTLINNNMYEYYKYVYENDFNLLDWFDSKKSCNIFLNDLSLKQKLLRNNMDIIITRKDKIGYWFTSKIGKILKNDKSVDESYKKIEKHINDIVKKNYKKLNRLYSHFT
jgi:hypothetical protein